MNVEEHTHQTIGGREGTAAAASGENPRMAAALGYAEEGIRVLPIYPPDPDQPGGCGCGNQDCSSPGKHPIHRLVRNGLKNATTDPEKIREWWSRYPTANVAAVPGEDQFVLDEDPDHGGSESLAKLTAEHGPIHTRQFRTGSGGRHFWLRSPEPVKQRTGILPGLDTRTSRGYVLMPPSNHVAGEYTLLDERPIGEAPTWLVELINGSNEADTDDTSAALVASDGPTALIGEGSRNSTLASIAGVAHSNGSTPEGVLALLREDNARRCVPPLPDSEVERIGRSICSYPREAATVMGHLGGLYEAARDDEPELAEVVVALSIAVSDGSLASPRVLDDLGRRVGRITSRRSRKLAEALIEKELGRLVGARQASELVRVFADEKRAGGIDEDADGIPQIAVLAPEHLQEIPFLVDGLIPAATVGAIVADFSMGKTLLAIDLGLSIAFETPFFDHPVQSAPVLFMVNEGSAGIPLRVLAWLVDHGLAPPEISVKDLFSVLEDKVTISHGAVRFDDPRFEDALRNTIEKTGAKLVVVDTYGKTLGPDQDENDNGDANEITGMLSAIAAETGATVILIHHVGKSNSTQARGASAFEQGLDFEFVVKGRLDELRSGEPAELVCRKLRDGELPRPLLYRLKEVPDLRLHRPGSLEPDPRSGVTVEPAESEDLPLTAEAEVFRTIEEQPGCGSGAIRGILGRRREDVNGLLATLEARGAIANHGVANHHKWYVREGWVIDLHTGELREGEEFRPVEIGDGTDAGEKG